MLTPMGHPILLCFTLGDTVSHNTILGIPAINMLEMLWNIKRQTVNAMGLQEPNLFPFTLSEVEYGIPKVDRTPPVHAMRQGPPSSVPHVTQYNDNAKDYQEPFRGAHRQLHTHSIKLDMGTNINTVEINRAIPVTVPPQRSNLNTLVSAILIDVQTNI
jgi:hypothetical protein